MPRTLLIVGFGRVGSAIAAQARGWRIAGAWCRSARSAARARAAGLRAFRGDGPLPASELALLTVPDAEIERAASWLAGRRVLPRAAAHTSGSLGLDVLAPLREAAVAVGSLHPFCSVAGPTTSLAGASCAIEGSPFARTPLRALARALSLRPLPRPPRDRARYHLAASLLASGAGVLAGQAEALLRRAGVARLDADLALAALLRSVADNLAAGGARGLLTGPIGRGDAAVVRRHLALLEGDARAEVLYRSLGRLVLERAEEEGGGDPKGLREIGKLLSRRPSTARGPVGRARSG
ncbi:MAG: DUF2520 domain-containing protein [Myxococcales bacterium]